MHMRGNLKMGAKCLQFNNDNMNISSNNFLLLVTNCCYEQTREY